MIPVCEGFFIMTCKPYTTRTTLRNLPDNAAFKFSTGSHVVYRLQSLDHKNRTATYTSEASKRTYKAGWGKEVLV